MYGWRWECLIALLFFWPLSSSGYNRSCRSSPWFFGGCDLKHFIIWIQNVIVETTNDICPRIVSLFVFCWNNERQRHHCDETPVSPSQVSSKWEMTVSRNDDNNHNLPNDSLDSRSNRAWYIATTVLLVSSLRHTTSIAAPSLNSHTHRSSSNRRARHDATLPNPRKRRHWR